MIGVATGVEGGLTNRLDPSELAVSSMIGVATGMEEGLTHELELLKVELEVR
jgi:hypothetical protein